MPQDRTASYSYGLGLTDLQNSFLQLFTEDPTQFQLVAVRRLFQWKGSSASNVHHFLVLAGEENQPTNFLQELVDQWWTQGVFGEAFAMNVYQASDASLSGSLFNFIVQAPYLVKSAAYLQYFSGLFTGETGNCYVHVLRHPDFHDVHGHRFFRFTPITGARIADLWLDSQLKRQPNHVPHRR